jgi:hypothetical protein
MCPDSAPRSEDIQVHVVADDQALADRMVAALSNGRWTNIPTIRSMRLTRTAYVLSGRHQGHIGRMVGVAGFEAYRDGADRAIGPRRNVFAVATKFTSRGDSVSLTTSQCLIDAPMGRSGVIVFVELPPQAGMPDANTLLSWRWWVCANAGMHVGKIVYHVGPLGAASDLWADIDAA